MRYDEEIRAEMGIKRSSPTTDPDNAYSQGWEDALA